MRHCWSDRRARSPSRPGACVAPLSATIPSPAARPAGPGDDVERTGFPDSGARLTPERKDHRVKRMTSDVRAPRRHLAHRAALVAALVAMSGAGACEKEAPPPAGATPAAAPVATPPSPVATPPPSPERARLDEALRLASERKYDGAVAIFEEMKAKQPDAITALDGLKLVVVYAEMGNAAKYRRAHTLAGRTAPQARARHRRGAFGQGLHRAPAGHRSSLARACRRDDALCGRARRRRRRGPVSRFLRHIARCCRVSGRPSCGGREVACNDDRTREPLRSDARAAVLRDGDARARQSHGRAAVARPCAHRGARFSKPGTEDTRSSGLTSSSRT